MDSKEILHKGIMYYRAYCKQCQRWEIYSFGDLVCGQATSDNGEGGEFANWGELVYLLKDGTGIFADDICKSKTIYDKLWVIQKRVDPEFIGFIPKEVGTNNLSHFVRWDDLEVIGNIHENPELLK